MVTAGSKVQSFKGYCPPPPHSFSHSFGEIKVRCSCQGFIRVEMKKMKESIVSYSLSGRQGTILFKMVYIIIFCCFVTCIRAALFLFISFIHSQKLRWNILPVVHEIFSSCFPSLWCCVGIYLSIYFFRAFHSIFFFRPIFSLFPHLMPHIHTLPNPWPILAAQSKTFSNSLSTFMLHLHNLDPIPWPHFQHHKPHDPSQTADLPP